MTASPTDLARVHPVRGDWLVHTAIGLYGVLPLLTIGLTWIGLRALKRALVAGVAASLVGNKLIVRGKEIPLLSSTSISLRVRKWAHILPVRTMLFTVHDRDGLRRTATLSLNGIEGGMTAVRNFMLHVEVARPSPLGNQQAPSSEALAPNDMTFDPDAIITRYLAAKQAGTSVDPVAPPRPTFGRRAI